MGQPTDRAGAGGGTGPVSIWLLLVGRWHPVVVHLPIGILLVAAALGAYARWRRDERLAASLPFLLFCGAASATLAAVTGWLTASEGEYRGLLLEQHRWLGLATVGAAWLAWGLAVRQPGRSAVLAGTVVLLAVAGHYGGALTHGPNHLWEVFAPRPVAVHPTSPTPRVPGDQELFFGAVVLPLLEAHCVACHGPEQVKGGLRLDGFAALVKGGDSGPVLPSQAADKSELLRRVSLPPDDDDYMPPKGEPLGTNQVALLRWWVAMGARTETRVGELPAPLKPLLTPTRNPHSTIGIR